VTTLDDAASVEDADAMQAAHFRISLVAERDQLADSIAKRRAIIDRRSNANHMRSQVRLAEAEVRHLNRLIERIDRRFSSQWKSGS
jgi:hypothetical protein